MKKSSLEGSRSKKKKKGDNILRTKNSGGIKVNDYISHDVTSGSEIMPCNKIDKPLVVYRFSGNVMTSIRTSRT